MKKILVLVFVLLFTFCLSSCGNEDVSSSSSKIESETVSSTIEVSSQIESSVESNNSQNISSQTVEEKVDKNIQETINKITTSNMSDIEKAKKTYEWLFYHFKYRSAVIDLSNGYTDELTYDLAADFFKYKKGSCEHYAAVQKLFLEQLGFNTKYVEGERLSLQTKEWGEHVWVMAEVDGVWYHVDGLYSGNHAPDLLTVFFAPDVVIQNSHRWDKESYPACVGAQLLS